MHLPRYWTSLGTPSPYNLYCAYLALKMHFTSNYNVFTYNGKVSAKEETFETRKDKFSFMKLARKKDPIGILLANIVSNPDLWIGDITQDNQGEEIYLQWKKRQESLSYMFGEELKKIGSVDDALYVDRGQRPALIGMINSHSVSLETACALQHILNFLPYWKREIDPILLGERDMIGKYLPFMEFDTEKLLAIFNKHKEDFD